MKKNTAAKQPEPKAEVPPVLNPRYEGATPEMIGRALMRRPADEQSAPRAATAE